MQDRCDTHSFHMQKGAQKAMFFGVSANALCMQVINALKRGSSSDGDVTLVLERSG